MTDVEPLPERVDRIERKLDALTESVDRRFDEVSEHFVEQGEYTEFAFDRLRKEMLEGFNRLERKLDTNTRGLDSLERKLDTNVERLESTIASFGRKLDRFMKGQARPPRHRSVRRVPKKR